MIEKISKTKSWFFETIIKLTNLQQKSSRKKKRAQIKSEIKVERFLTGTAESQRITKEYQLCIKKSDHPEELDKFPETQKSMVEYICTN